MAKETGKVRRRFADFWTNFKSIGEPWSRMKSGKWREIRAPNSIELDADRSNRVKIPGIRWIIAALLFLAAILNYIDRQALSILAPTIQKDLPLTDADYAHLTNLFLIAYTISLLLSGRLVGKICWLPRMLPIFTRSR